MPMGTNKILIFGYKYVICMAISMTSLTFSSINRRSILAWNCETYLLSAALDVLY